MIDSTGGLVLDSMISWDWDFAIGVLGVNSVSLSHFLAYLAYICESDLKCHGNYDLDPG